MATESPVRILPGVTTSLAAAGASTAGSRENHELNLLLRERSRLENVLNGRDMLLHRSESAPPSVEGSLAAMGGFYVHNPTAAGPLSRLSGDDLDMFESEQELRSDPAYFAYYHSHVNLNPRLPPPLRSRENWRVAQRLQSNISTGERSFEDNSSKSLFSSQPMLPTHREEEAEQIDEDRSTLETLLYQSQRSNEWREEEDGAAAFGGMGQIGRPKSLVDLIQEDFPRTPSPVYTHSRPPSRAANDEDDIQLAQFRDVASGLKTLSKTPSIQRLNDIGESDAEINGAAYCVRSTTPSPGGLLGATSSAQNIKRLSSPDGTSRSVGSSNTSTTAELAAALQGLNVKSGENDAWQDEPNEQQFRLQQQQQHLHHHQQQQQQQRGQVTQAQALQLHLYNNHDQAHRTQTKYGVPGVQPGATAPNVYAAAAAAAAMSYIAAGNPYYQNLHSASVYPYGLGGYPMIPQMMGGYPPAGGLPAFDSAAVGAANRAAVPDLQQFYKMAGNPSLQDAFYLQQYLRASEDVRAATGLTDPSAMRGYMGDALDLHKSYGLEQKSHFQRSNAIGVPVGSKSGSVSPYYGSPPGAGFAMPYPNSPLAASPVLPTSPGASSRRDDRSARLLSTVGRGSSGYAGWHPQRSGETADEIRGSFLLEEFKNNKSRRFELPDIVGHVVEFSGDQHGSRFIQQKLETATSEEKSMIFQEVFPQAVVLMTDVFGNYVIQKFFEHGTTQQRRELANQLISRVLTLSLQMYGCRVVQKALEVVDIDQQIELVAELDGHVMRCVRDQNGNHVIQKSIECVPSDRIQFIIDAFYGQVVALSTHPYGCRVIQRVLEHCTDEQKQHGIMEEILGSTCNLAQDQYGNYVVQHVLEHGTGPERKEIITKLAGQIVQMSQHKFASNVIEKCLEFGGPGERQILINEMLGTTDENEPLQAMMKDQFANYVVQKVLEICDDHQRDVLLTRIKVHLHALKKYTYGKHIVARVEKLVAAGERRSNSNIIM